MHQDNPMPALRKPADIVSRKLAGSPGVLVAAIFVGSVFIYACGVQPITPSDSHISAPSRTVPGEAPQPVRRSAILPRPSREEKTELYSITVNDVPVRDLLFSIARGAQLNVDIHQDIEGIVSLNAVRQTLPQILNRLSRLVDMRYELDGANLLILPDRPFLRSYVVDYVNIVRETKSSLGINTQINTSGVEGTSGEGNTSQTGLDTISSNRFWQTLTENIRHMLRETGAASGEEAESVIANPENGVLMVRATAKQHAVVQVFLDRVMAAAKRQVLIEATVVEVQLSDLYQQGVDWQILSNQAMGENIALMPLGPEPLPTGANPGGVYNRPILPPSGEPVFGSGYPAMMVLNYMNPLFNWGANITATLSLLESFGQVRVLSSPKLSVLNSQSAMLRVVDNKVYFSIDVDITAATTTSPRTIIYSTTARTVPVGFMMAITPQIDDADTVTLHVRPTINRIVGFVNDPNPDLARAGVVNQVPEIQTREMESILTIPNGQVAVMGGLMQETLDQKTDGVPGLSRLPLIGNVFSYRKDQVKKSELVLFLRPVVIKQPGLDGDYRQFQRFLPQDGFFGEPLPIPDPSQHNGKSGTQP